MKKIIQFLFLKDYNLSTPIPNWGNILAFFTALSVCICVSGFLFFISGRQYLYYASCALSLLYVVFKGGISFNKQMLLFYAVIIVNVLVLPINPIFRPQARALNFILISLVCSPALNSNTAIAYRERVFKYVLIGFSILTVLSFFCFFLGINMMPFNREGSSELYEDYINVGGKFSGLFTHSMIFGPIAALVSLLYFNFYLKHNNVHYLILFIICSLACVFSASRAALLGLGLGVVFVLFRTNKLNKSYFSLKKIVMLVLFVGLAIVSFSDIAFKGLINKMEITEEQFGGISSREIKYARRLYEFSESPIMGIGFASIDISTGDAYNEKNGQIEPGSAHFAVLSQTGLVGMIAYFILLFGALKAIKRRSIVYANIAFSFFWMFFGHGWGEGWIFAPGGMICFMFWLSLSQCYDLKFKNSYLLL